LKNTLFFSIFLICQFLFSQSTFTKGRVLDSIQVANTKNETFSLYLPNSFDENGLSPIVFVFEPAARGAIGIDPFIDASEEYGHIIVCSNNSRNGPYERNFKIAQNLFDAIFSNFNIDANRMYLAGFSGGSRLATAIACLSNKFNGVIGCGAGFSGAHAQTPTFQDFAYAGICGNEDANYREMVNNRGFLQQFNFNNTLISFDGNHQWPPRKEINKAFRWLALQENKGSVNNDLILKSFQTDFEETKAFLDSDKVLLAAENYDRMLQSYGSVLKIDSVLRQYKNLTKSKPYKEAKKALSSALNVEAKLINKLVGRLKSDFKNPKKADFEWWSKEMGKLDAIQNRKGEEFKKMVARIKFNLFIMIYERHNTNSGELTDSEIELGKKIKQIIYPQ